MDILLLKEYDRETKKYTGSWIKFRISYILNSVDIPDLVRFYTDFGAGFVIMGLKELEYDYGN